MMSKQYKPAIAGSIGRIPMDLLMKLSSFCDPILDFSLTTLQPKKDNKHQSAVLLHRQYIKPSDVNRSSQTGYWYRNTSILVKKQQILKRL